MPVIEISALVDARGLSGAMAIDRTAQALRSLPRGAAVELLATDPSSIDDVASWVQLTRYDLVTRSSDGAVYRFVIRRT